MFSRRNSLAKRASVLASIALIGAKAQSEEEARLLVAVTKPKITAVGDGFATVTFTSGPNLFSNDYTVSCYTRNLDTPTTSCAAVSTLDPAGSVDGKTPKVYGKLTANVTGLPGDEVYDCFINVYGPGGYDKCKYVGSTDIDCFEPGAPTVDELISTTVFDEVDDLWETDITVDWTEGSAPNPVPADDEDVFGAYCLPTTPDVKCPADAPLNIPYSDAGIAATVTTVGETADPLVPNTAYTCYTLVEDTCATSTTADAICSDGVEIVTAYAPPQWDIGFEGVFFTDIAFPVDGDDAPINGDALAIITYVGCYDCGTDCVDELATPNLSYVTDDTQGGTGWFLTSDGASYDPVNVFFGPGAYICFGLTGTECVENVACLADNTCTGCNNVVVQLPGSPVLVE